MFVNRVINKNFYITIFVKLKNSQHFDGFAFNLIYIMIFNDFKF